MDKIRRLKPRLLLPVSDQTPPSTPIDAEIARNKGRPIEMEVTSDSLQSSKNAPTLSLSEVLEQSTRKNAQLKEKLAKQQKKQGGELYLLEEVRLVIEKLQQALIEYHKLQGPTDQDGARLGTYK